METKRVGRPPKTSREEILDTAALSDPLTLQLTTLASELGISVKTVYYYFPTRKALLAALTERAVQEMGAPELSGSTTWQEVIGATARWFYDIGETEPGWYAQTAAPQGAVLAVTDQVMQALVELGWAPRDALRAIVVVANWAVAAGEAAHRARATGGLGAANVHRYVDDYVDAETAERMVALFSQFDLDEVYADGLRTVVAGISATIAPAGPASRGSRRAT